MTDFDTDVQSLWFEVLVDLGQSRVSAGVNTFIRRNVPDEVISPLSSSDRALFLEALSPVLSWGDAWQDVQIDDTESPESPESV